MTSSNEQIPHPLLKTRVSPLEFKNNELVSRLLAATPPYLYNMSLLPNTYFFSEMLRSLVQARVENANRNNLMTGQIRRSRKRNWTTLRNDNFVPKSNTKMEKVDNEWEKPTNPNEKPVEMSTKVSENPRVSEFKIPNKVETQTSNSYQQSEFSNPNLVLPPAPPIWFPPIYPSPYVDPLHFFIDLRVSGHIYDKNQRETHSKENLPSTVTSSSESSAALEPTTSLFNLHKDYRHKSAFSVPNQKKSSTYASTKCTKFDVKSMGFEKPANKLNPLYVMSNIKNIYGRVEGTRDVIEEFPEAEKSEDSKSTLQFESISDYTSRSSRSRSSNSSGSSSVDVVDLQDDQDIKLDI